MLYAQGRKEFERSVIGELNRPRAANHDSCCGPASDEWPSVHDRLHAVAD